MHIEAALKKVHNFGIFQKFSMFLLALIGLFHGWQTSSANFISGKSEHWCKVDELQWLPHETQKYIAAPYTPQGSYDSCHVFDLPWWNYSRDDLLNWNRSAINETSTATKTCGHWVHSRLVFTETANSKWDLVCSQSLLGELISPFYVAGLFIGSVSSGKISDAIGRSKSQLGFMAILMGVLYAAAFVNDVIIFCVLRFLTGLSMRGTNMSASVLVMEISGPHQRELAGILVPGFFAIGVMICSGCAYALRDFQLLHIVMAGFATCMLLQYFVVPESPRWLMISGQKEKAEKIVRWMGEVNNSPLPHDCTIEAKDTSTATHKKRDTLSYIDLYRHPVLRKHILIVHFLWIAVNFSHIAMTLNLGALTGNAYLNVFLSGLTELPASVIILFTMRCMGRTKSFILFGIIFAVCNAIAVPMELIPEVQMGATVFTILARASASALLSNLRVLTSELFPTPVRQRVNGAMTGAAAAVSISSSFVGGALREVWRPLPNVIFGTLGVIAVILTFFLPETLGQPMPDTLEEAVALAKGNKRDLKAEHLPTLDDGLDKPINTTSQNRFVYDNPTCDDIFVVHL